MLMLVDVDRNVLMPEPRRRQWLSLRAQLKSDSLDSQLADGLAPESSDLLFAHARRIVRPRSCAALASSLRKVALASQGPTGLSNQVPVVREAIDTARDELLGLAERLERPGPVRARGVAQVRRLLGNGSSPFYCRAYRGRVLADLRAAAAHL
jgi:hypothetical protein